MKPAKYIFYILLTLLSIGCANNYQKFYVQRIPSNELTNLDLLKSDQTPNVFSTDNINRDVNILRSKRYLVIGTSEFNAQFENIDNAKEVAKSIGATIVLLSSTYTNTQSAVVPFFLPNTSTTTSSGIVSAPYAPSATYSGTSTTYGTSVVPFVVNNRRYDQIAVYFAQSKIKPKVGIYFNDLSDKERKEFGQNTGVIVQTVIENSPAFLANIINGDLITKIDGNEVVNTSTLLKELSNKRIGEKISFTIVRNGKLVQVSLITSDSYNWNEKKSIRSRLLPYIFVFCQHNGG